MGVLSLCRDTIGVFYRPSRINETLDGISCLSGMVCVLVPNVGSFSSHPLDLKRQCLLQALDENLTQSPNGKMNGGKTSPSLVTNSNIMIWTGCMVFINISSLCGDRARPMVVSWVHYLILVDSFLIWEKANHVRLDMMLELVQKLCGAFFFISFTTCDKNCPFLIL